MPQPERLINVELDVEKRLMALVLKDRVRIKQFFLDFDRLRKGTVGVAAVSVTSSINLASYSLWSLLVYSSEHAWER